MAVREPTPDYQLWELTLAHTTIYNNLLILFYIFIFHWCYIFNKYA